MSDKDQNKNQDKNQDQIQDQNEAPFNSSLLVSKSPWTLKDHLRVLLREELDFIKISKDSELFKDKIYELEETLERIDEFLSEFYKNSTNLMKDLFEKQNQLIDYIGLIKIFNA